MRLRLSETKLSCDECELGHLLAGFLPHRSLVKLRQLLQLGLGELVRIGSDRVLSDTRPIEIFGEKPLQDLSLGSELRIELNLGVHDLVGNLWQALIDFHHDEQILRSLAMSVVISQRDDRGKPQDNREQARVQQHSHHTILLCILISQAQGEEEGSSATHPLSIPLETRTSRPLTRGERHAPLCLCRASRILCTMSLVSSCNTAASSQTRWECWHVASAIRTRNDRCRGALPAWSSTCKV